MRSSQWPFSGLEPPEPPGDLRERVLTAARVARAADEGRAPVEWTLRLWRSRELWLAWAVGMVFLLGVNAWLSMSGVPGSSRAEVTGAIATTVEATSPSWLAESGSSWKLFEVQRILTADSSSLVERSGGSDNHIETYLALREVL
ncbi:MAG: hypothetical protein K0U98_00295 [Deltaproteobacteria bacterium]|nr:hypothetical protein [Deltaproteobacteria bacterium]